MALAVCNACCCFRAQSLAEMLVVTACQSPCATEYSLCHSVIVLVAGFLSGAEVSTATINLLTDSVTADALLGLESIPHPVS